MTTNRYPAGVRPAPALTPLERPTGGRVKDAMRRFTKRMFPLMRPLAGRRWLGLFVVLHHHGRKSGRAYSTVLASARTPDGLILPMTFGESAHWVHNLRAEGGAEIERSGRRYVAGPPETIDYARAARAFNPVLRLALRVAGIRSFVRVSLTVAPDSIDGDRPPVRDRPVERSPGVARRDLLYVRSPRVATAMTWRSGSSA